jgi:hypothetical protein
MQGRVNSRPKFHALESAEEPSPHFGRVRAFAISKKRFHVSTAFDLSLPAAHTRVRACTGYLSHLRLKDDERIVPFLFTVCMSNM